MFSCRSEAVTTERQLQAARSEAAALAVSQAQLQHQLAEVESQRQQSHSEQALAERRLQQLQVLHPCFLHTHEQCTCMCNRSNID